MNIAELARELARVTPSRLHETASVVVRVEGPATGEARWLELAAAGIAFVNGRFVLQLGAGQRDGEPGVHW